jgi:outer membrane receptor protein involved in Fe transport
VGIFAQDEFSVVPDVTLTAGVRYSHIVLESLLESPYGEIKDSYGDVTGSLALTCMLSNDLNLIGSWSRGFRAPNLNDVVVLKESSSGVDAPSIGLAPEKSNNFELGAKLRTARTRGSLFFYYNILSDMIDRKPGTYDGKPYIDLNDNGEQDSDEPDVFQRQNVGRSRIYGVEFDASAKLTDMFETKCNCFWTYGKNQTDDEPLSRIPPLMGMLALRMDVSRKHWVEFYVRAATSQRRLSQRDIDDSRIEENGTPSWVTLNLRAGIDLGDLNLNLGFENLADATYKEHGSGIYSPGRNMTLTLTYGLH